MIAVVTDPGVGLRLSRASLKRETTALTARGGYAHGWTVGTRHGLPVLRCRDRYADDVRDAFRALRQWADVTGYRLTVECNVTQARALLAGRLVTNDGGLYTITGGRL